MAEIEQIAGATCGSCRRRSPGDRQVGQLVAEEGRVAGQAPSMARPPGCAPTLFRTANTFMDGDLLRIDPRRPEPPPEPIRGIRLSALV